MIVDPVKRRKAPLFDHAKMAATLTTLTRIPYDAQHLPFSNVGLVKSDTAGTMTSLLAGIAIVLAVAGLSPPAAAATRAARTVDGRDSSLLTVDA